MANTEIQGWDCFYPIQGEFPRLMSVKMDFPPRNVPMHYVNRDKHLIGLTSAIEFDILLPYQTKWKIGFKKKNQDFIETQVLCGGWVLPTAN